MVFTGTTGAPAQHFPNPSHTVVDNTPKIREKPFLYVDGSGEYRVFVPALRQNARGTIVGERQRRQARRSRSRTSTSSSRAPRPRPSTPRWRRASTCCSRRASTTSTDTIRVTNPNTVVLGLGLATLTPDTGQAAMTVSDVDGVKLAGMLIDAGPQNSPVLVEVGPAGSSASHAANPTSLHDVFFRVGGAARRQGHGLLAGQQQRRDRRPHVAVARRPRHRRRLEHEHRRTTAWSSTATT